ncbi:MAG: hypothetical protein EYR95_18530 [Phormidium sp. SL48-SHIP]|nr:MAG: hypothetical protein EYR95_18530 [Phormidium sp. SL48-SHIP]
MKNPNLYYIYSKSAAQRIFDAEVKKVQIFHNCILVVFNKGQGLKPKFVAKRVFKAHFAEYRKASARQVFVSYKPIYGYFRAPSSNLQESYRIELFPRHLKCSCADWRTQEEIGIKSPMCKHAYAVLDYIGNTSLADYIERRGCEFVDHQRQTEGTDIYLQEVHQEKMTYDY